MANVATGLVMEAIVTAAAAHDVPAAYVKANVKVKRTRMNRWSDARGTKVWGFRDRGAYAFPDGWKEREDDWYRNMIATMGKKLGQWYHTAQAHNANETKLASLLKRAGVDPKRAEMKASADDRGFHLELDNLNAKQMLRLLKVARRCGALKAAE